MASRSDEGEQLTSPVLTWRSSNVLRFICEYTAKNNYSPSFKEIGEAVGLHSSSAVSHQLRLLERLGYIERYRWAPRKIRILENPWQSEPSSGRPGPT